MLRALLEREIVPDLVLGTSVGALNGAMVARQPHVDVIDRLTELWAATAQSKDVYGDRPLRTVRRAVSTGTHIYSPGPLRARLEEELGDATFEDLPVTFGVCAASIERAAEHWFTTGPIVPAILASAAVPGLLPPARIETEHGVEHFLDGGLVNSIPVGRAVELGADRIFVLQVGRIDRPLKVPEAPVGGRAGQLRGRPPPPLHARHGHDPRGRGDARPARGRHVDPRRLGAQPPRLRQRAATHRCVVRRLPRLPGRRRCDPPGGLGPAPAGRGAGGDRPDRPDLGDAAGVAPGGGGARARAAGPLAGAAAAVGGHPLPDLRDAAAGRAAGAVAGQRLRVEDPLALLRRHPLRPRPGHARSASSARPGACSPCGSAPTARTRADGPTGRCSCSVGTRGRATRSS